MYVSMCVCVSMCVDVCVYVEGVCMSVFVDGYRYVCIGCVT